MQKSINKLRILTPEKFQAEYPHIFKRNFGEIALNRVHFCKAECLRQAVTGTFAIPRKTKLTGDKITFGYCIAEEQLIFIENQDHIKIEMKKSGNIRMKSVLRHCCFCLTGWSILSKMTCCFCRIMKKIFPIWKRNCWREIWKILTEKSCYPERNFLC